MEGKCGSLSHPAEEENWGLQKKQGARLAHAPGTGGVCSPVLLGGEGSCRAGKPGLILLLAGGVHRHSSSQGGGAVSPSPYGFFGAPQGPLPLSLAPGWLGHGVVLEPGGAPCSPEQCPPHRGGGRAETPGRTSHNPELLPAGAQDG